MGQIAKRRLGGAEVENVAVTVTVECQGAVLGAAVMRLGHRRRAENPQKWHGEGCYLRAPSVGPEVTFCFL